MKIDVASTFDPVPAFTAGTGLSAVSAAAAVRAVPDPTAAQSETTEAEPRRASQVEPERSQLEAASSTLQQHFQLRNISLRFNVDEDLGSLVVKVTDASSGELLRQIPSAEALRLAKAVDDGDVALLDQTA
jgi:flagellar protein FlaG